MAENGTVYSLSIDYEMSVDEAKKRGNYDWVNNNITQENFPTKRKGKAEIEIKLFHFNRYISSEDVIKEMDNAGYRPAELHELLVLGEKYPDLQREFPIAALGSVWLAPDGNRDVPFLNRLGSKRILNLSWLELDWNGRWRFVALRK